MKKEYNAPLAEKVEFNYVETVTASDGGGCGTGGGNVYNNDPYGQYFKCSCENYYGAGWGQNC